MTNYIALAIPFFFLLMGVELWAARRRALRVYRFNDAIVDLSCGMTQQILLVFAVGVLGAGYLWLYQHRFFTLSAPWAWVVAFFAVDLIYYWWHRLSHRVNFLWAVHVVHHQSEDYNLAVALRQAVLSVWTIWPFHLPLALVGVPPVVFATVESFSTLYQFWIHTELMGKLGWYERIFNTPSQHRVHHAINPRYLDRNYAATLCIWDRLFGTFEEEREQPVFGLVKPLSSFNPIYAQVQAWVALWHSSREARGWDRLRVWLKGPDWRPGGLRIEAPAVTRASQRKHDPRFSRRLTPYVALNLVLTIVGTTYLMFTEFTMSLPRQIALAALLLLTMLSWGALLEQRRWATPLELGRLALTAAIAAAWLGTANVTVASLCIASLVVLGIWFLRARAVEAAAVAA
ncbi:MAG TPA: sterol desaturase family protein [Gemmatimonadales bacterium]|nr:sterol desaturase family protein [Gemmatimonadales bacterium]